MGRPIGKLKALTVARVKQPGMYGDGGGLYLQVSGAGARSWIFRYWVEARGVSREMGLGSAFVVGLEEAREIAAECRKLRRQGIDPLEARRRAKTQTVLNVAKSVPFMQCVEDYFTAHEAGWGSVKHAEQWKTSLKTYANPIIGALPVNEIDTAWVMKALQPIWATKTETANRVRGRIEAVLDWAKVSELRSGENPARWRGHLDKLLPKREKVAKTQPFTAMPYAEVPAFLTALKAQRSTGARALEFTIFTAARTGETLSATWDEIDLTAKVWTIPANKMKAGKEHRVPLSGMALALLSKLPRNGDFVFASEKAKRLSPMAMLDVLERMGITKTATVHGFRSSFRDWAAECTNTPNHVVEMALAHSIGGVEGAYRRGDLFEKRRRLMDGWARFCSNPPQSGAVVPLRAAH